MAIIGSASKASRASNYSGSSTDDDLLVKQRQRNPGNELLVNSHELDAAGHYDGTEICQVGDELCAVPTDLFELPDLKNILSLDTWNFCLTEDERESLVAFLPPMGEYDFRLTIRELLRGENFHFCSPLVDLFDRLKGGHCVPRVARYKEGLIYLQRKKHYHLLRQYHNRMVNSFLGMLKAWEGCPQAADIEDRLQIWDTWKAHKSQPKANRKRGIPKKLKPAPQVGRMLDFVRKGPVETPPEPTPITTGTRKVGSKGVLKMKVVNKVEVVNVDPPVTSEGEREVERVKVPAPKGVLKLVPKGRLLPFGNPEPAAKEILSIAEARGVGSPGARPTILSRKDMSSDLHQSIAEQYVEKKKRRTAGESKKKKKSNDVEREREIEWEQQKEREMEQDANEHEVSENIEIVVDTPDAVIAVEPDRKKKKKIVYEKKIPEEEKILYNANKAKKKPFSKKSSEGRNESIESEQKERAEEKWMLIHDVKEDVQVDRGQADVKEHEVPKAARKRPKKKPKEEKGEVSPIESSPEPPRERGASVKSAKKLTPLSIPSIASTFSFSVPRLLSAVRMAMLRQCGDACSDFEIQIGGAGESLGFDRGFLVASEEACLEPNNVSSGVFADGVPHVVGGKDLDGEKRSQGISFTEIVRRVQENPGDPRILEAEENVQDMVRGVLKVLCSRVAPPGAKGWKPLAAFDKETRTWAWTGPGLASSASEDSSDVQASSDAWGVPAKTMTKVEEVFANWLKHGQETVQQMFQLPLLPPPQTLTSLDEKERFRDLRAQKSLMTITPSSEDMRAYFQREERVRYSLPDRAFLYTTADGQKSIVAPLRRCGGKPTAKARDHFMLKPDRPSQVTILCLVRDAAARLPGSIGTRADVCTLIRDSQFVVDDVTDAQVNQVVSGALDRLHYERDPCVKFDGDRKLWMYLHTNRQEEDFEDDGTSSTKRWKKTKKENAENGELGVISFDNGSPSGTELDGARVGLTFAHEMEAQSNPSAIYSVGRTELVYSKSCSLRSPCVLVNTLSSSNEEGGVMSYMELAPSPHPEVDVHTNHSMDWQRVDTTWGEHHLLHLQEHFRVDDNDPEAVVTAQQDADAMIEFDVS